MTYLLQCLLWTVGLLMVPCLVSSQMSHDFDTTASDVAGQLAQHFPHLEGEVVEVQGEQLYLALGARDLVLTGMRLNVYREGEELTSPTTGEVLGWLEEDFGTATVTQVAESYAVAELDGVPEGGRVQAGDKVRITAGSVTLVLLPISDPGESGVPMLPLYRAVQRNLSATGRFQVVPEARLTLWLLEHGRSPGDALVPDVMSEVANGLGATYVVQQTIRVAGNATFIELRLFSPAQPLSPVTVAVAAFSESVLSPPRPDSRSASQARIADTGPLVPPEATPSPTSSAPNESVTTLTDLLNAAPLALERRYLPLAQLPTELRGFDAADIDGDGQSELVMLSGTKVLLYRVQESQLVSVASYSDRRPGTLLSAQLVRLGDEQVSGVVVNRYSARRRGMDSFFLILQGNRLVRQQKGLSVILLAVDMDGDGLNDRIWGQSFDKRDFFRRGQVRQYEFRNGRLKRRGKLSLPGGFRATGAVLAQLGRTGNRHLVFVDGRRNLQVYDGESRRWKSSTNVGGSFVFAAVDVQFSPQVSVQEQFDFEAIPAVADFDGDGVDEILVPQNKARVGALPNLNLYSDGHVALVRQTPQGFVLSRISPQFDGLVSGVALLTGKIKGILVAVSKREGVLKQKKQTILYLNRL